MKKAEGKEKAASEKATKIVGLDVNKLTQSLKKYLSRTLSRHWHLNR